MTQENKELLLKDLSARFPYGVKCEVYGRIGILDEISSYGVAVNYDNGEDTTCRIECVKPYLFPLSSMTEEQWNNAPTVNLTEFTFESLKCGCFTLASYTCENDLCDLVEFINWLLKNHFDIYGLIPMGLAIDSTGKNIY